MRNADEVRLRVSAPRYSSIEFDVSIPHDFCGDPVTQRRDVTLSKTGSPKVVVGPEIASGCK